MERDFARLESQYREAGLQPQINLQSPWLSEGLSPGEICLYPAHQVSQVEADQGMCSICITSITAGEWTRTLDCGHNFHVQCLDPWLFRQDVCPNCKRNIRRSALEQPLLPPGVNS